jgi:hypothetical protein
VVRFTVGHDVFGGPFSDTIPLWEPGGRRGALPAVPTPTRATGRPRDSPSMPEIRFAGVRSRPRWGARDIARACAPRICPRAQPQDRGIDGVPALRPTEDVRPHGNDIRSAGRPHAAANPRRAARGRTPRGRTGRHNRPQPTGGVHASEGAPPGGVGRGFGRCATQGLPGPDRNDCTPRIGGSCRIAACGRHTSMSSRGAWAA